jgi:hypothetical protein
MFFINCESGRYHSTVDEFTDKGEAMKMAANYQSKDHGRAYYYVSRMARANWSES